MWENEPINIGERLLIHSIDGHRVFLDEDELHMTCHMIEHHEWEPHIREVLRIVLGPGDTFVDVGANIGLHSLYAAALIGPTGELYAIEPNPRLMKILKTNMEVNGFYERCKFEETAISDCEGVATFNAYEGHASMSGFMGEHFDFEAARIQFEVPVSTLDTLIASPMNVKCLKIDVEGFEHLVLKGSKILLECSKDITVILEWNPHDTKERCGGEVLDGILNIFEDMGYAVYCARFMQPLKKLDFKNKDEILAIPFGDLVFTLNEKLDILTLECYKEKGNETEETLASQIEELLHLRKAYAEAIEVQEQLKEEIISLQNIPKEI